MKNKKLLLIFITFVTFSITIFLLFTMVKNNNIETEGEYSGYQLLVEANYWGYGIAGQNLGSGAQKKIFNISENDILYEPISGGNWSLNADATEVIFKTGDIGILKYGQILEIIKIEEDKVQFKNEDKIYNIKYNEKFEVSSNFSVSDGINYYYVVTFIKK